MEMRASRPLPVTQQQAWEALNDPQTLKQCLAGCEKFEPTEEGQYSVAMAVKIGPVSAKFSGKVMLSEVNPPHSYTIAFEGQGGVAGFGKGQAQVQLGPVPEAVSDTSQCLLEYSVNAQVGGKIAQLGQRLIDGAAKNMADDFFTRFEALMKERYPQAPKPAEDVPEPMSPAADAQAWAHDAVVASGTAMPLDAVPVPASILDRDDAQEHAPHHAQDLDRSGLPWWCWVLAAVIVLGAIWLLTRG